MSGVERIAAERARQVDEEGYTAEQDDRWEAGQLAEAAACYSMPGNLYVERRFAGGVRFVDPWPFRIYLDKRRSVGANYPDRIEVEGEERIDRLVKAGALIAAEIDRLQRVTGEQPCATCDDKGTVLCSCLDCLGNVPHGQSTPCPDCR